MRIVQVDAFTTEPFRGNPAAVCVLPDAAEVDWMQHVAREMNLSETAFLHREGEAFRLRWFTPTVEVSLCGHATLASAHVLWEDGFLDRSEVARFRTQGGPLSAAWSDGWIEMDFPAKPGEAVLREEGLADALGVRPVSVHRNDLDFLVELEDEAAVRGVRPDFRAMAELAARGVIVTAPPAPALAEEGIHFVSRYFAPAFGVNEDPVTGSAHCFLGPFWSDRIGRSDLLGRQLSDRGGLVGVRCEGDRVTLRGQAVTVLKARLTVRHTPAEPG